MSAAKAAADKAPKAPKAPKAKASKKVVDIKDAPKKVASQEKLINVLLAPHITEKTSLAMQDANTYSFRVLPLLGELVAQDRDAYRYLAESIRRFPDQDAFAALMSSAGLEQVKLIEPSYQ